MTQSVFKQFLGIVSMAFAFLEPTNDVSWANEILPLLGVGPEVPLWASLAVADWMVKVSLALIALVPFRVIVARMTGETPESRESV